MKEGLKVAVIGGGSSYTPEIVEGFILKYEEMPICELWLVDIEAGREKLEIVGNLAKRMVEKAGLPMKVELTLDRKAAIEGADFVTTQLRVGLLEARKWDEHLPNQFGVIGQETTGPGGMMKALRTIPVILDICKDMEQYAPNAWLLNFTNPSGIVTEAVGKYSKVRSVGLCNAPIGFQKAISNLYQVPIKKVLAEFVGINHLHWITSVYVEGINKLHELIENQGKVYAGINVPDFGWDADFLRSLDSLPSYYLKYYYMKDQMLEKQQDAIKKEGSRAEVVKALEEELFQLYRDPNLKEKPKQLEQRGGAYYSEAAVNLMHSLHNDVRDIQTLNVKNGGIIPFLPADASIEVNCVVTSNGPIPLPLSRIPRQIKGLLHAVKTYEELTIEAAVSGDRDIALMAMANHPLVPSAKVAKELLNTMLAQNKPFLQNFFK